MEVLLDLQLKDGICVPDLASGIHDAEPTSSEDQDSDQKYFVFHDCQVQKIIFQLAFFGVEA